MRLVLAVLLTFIAPCFGQRVHTYIGQIESRAVLVAWGTTKGPNTIGRSSPSLGPAVLTIGGQTIRTEKNYSFATGLEPDHVYRYEVAVNGKMIGDGNVRTWPEHSTSLCFFVLGDYGTGLAAQTGIAAAMTKEYEKRSAAGVPVRFVMTTGDNIYADINFGFKAVHSGNDDGDWESKFFHPYESLLREIPFYPSPGNHDGNGTENRDDLNTYLDNFFYPHDQPARWYTFQFADLAQFFSLDSTTNSDHGPPRPAYAEDGAQFAWFRKTIVQSQAPWKIPYWHHPVFNAGPYHPASLKDLKHFMPVFQESGVKVVFSGHEHNFQFSDLSPVTGGVRYVVSGAGGELRHGDVRHKMASAHIEGWAAERHFLVVEINGDTMTITPIGVSGPIQAVNASGAPVTMPLVIRNSR